MTETSFWQVVLGLSLLVGWGFRVEMRVRQHERDIAALQASMTKALDGIAAAVEKAVQPIREDVTYIRTRLDHLTDRR